MNQTIQRLEVRGVFPLLDILVMKLEANPRVGDCCFCVEGLFFVAMDQNSAPLSQFFYDVGT